MSASLIIDARHRLRWHRRLLSDASTALLWSGWFWLWMPLLRAYASLADMGARLTPALPKLLALGADDALGHSVVALLGASGTLIVWNHLPGPRACAAPALSLREHAQHFQLPEHELRAGREAAVCVVHHDAHGRIVRVERRDLAGHAEGARPGRPAVTARARRSARAARIPPAPGVAPDPAATAASAPRR